MDEYRMTRRVLMAEVSGGRLREKTVIRLGGWREDGLGQQRDDGGGYATMNER